MKALSLTFFLLIHAIPVHAEIAKEVSAENSSLSSSSGRANCLALGCELDRVERNATREEYQAAKIAIQAKMREARTKRREAMKAARALEGDERAAAIAAAKAAYKETVEPLKAERKALQEKYHASNSSSDEARALAAANKADNVLKGNAKKNEEVSQQILSASDKAAEPAAASASPAKEIAPAVEREEKLKKRSGSTVSAQ